MNLGKSGAIMARIAGENLSLSVAAPPQAARIKHMNHHPELLIVAAKASAATPALAAAAQADLHEIMGEFDLRTSGQASAEHMAMLLAGDEPFVAITRDILNPTASLIDGMLAALEEFDLAIGPAFDGSLYALACAGTHPFS